MKTVESLADLRRALDGRERPLGLVPTMGYLHDGHLSLVRAARAACPSVAVSIFVNPTQFGPNEDLDSYPRDLDRDIGLLEEAGADVVWTPQADALYPDGFQTWVTVEQVAKPLEGAQRPGHFRGVTTVVAKLFHAFKPDDAFFGQKDAQQVVVIKRMVRDLDFPLRVHVCPTVRESDGLAMSSRNTYLNPAERQAATVLHRALTAAEELFASGERGSGALRRQMDDVLAAEPLASVQYASVADPVTLQELDGRIESALLSMAVYIGETRLIDNILLGDRPLGG
jgi:pantoate--beta-alanine ligase